MAIAHTAMMAPAAGARYTPNTSQELEYQLIAWPDTSRAKPMAKMQMAANSTETMKTREANAKCFRYEIPR